MKGLKVLVAVVMELCHWPGAGHGHRHDRWHEIRDQDHQPIPTQNEKMIRGDAGYCKLSEQTSRDPDPDPVDDDDDAPERLLPASRPNET